MRISVIAIVLVCAGCAGQPPAPAAAPAPPPAPVAHVAMASQPAPTTPEAAGAPIDTKLLTDAKKLGYKVVNQNGQELFCSDDVQTGSHVHRETVCMTAADMQSLRDQTRQHLNNTMRQTAPPVNH
jgi:hypothetical protein